MEIEAWSLLHADDAYPSAASTVTVALRKCEIVGNMGPGVSVRSPFKDGSEDELGGGGEAAAGSLAARITLEDCKVSGNERDPRVITAPLGLGSAVVWNKTERGAHYKEACCDASYCSDDDDW